LKNILLSKLIGISLTTVQNWKNEKRPIIQLLEKFFTDDEISEFLTNKNIASRQLVAVTVSDEIIEYALRARIADFREYIGFMDTAYIKYLIIFWREIMLKQMNYSRNIFPTRPRKRLDSGMLVRRKKSATHDEIINKKVFILDGISSANPQFSWGDFGIIPAFKDKIKKEVTHFFQNLTGQEIDFIFDNPIHFERILQDSFSKFENFSLGLYLKDI
jgi:hypothetical protein